MNDSYWLKSVPETTYPKLEQNQTADTVIIGAGITGLTTAYYISKDHRDVILLEADKIAYGASGRSTGKLSSQHGLLYRQLSEQKGRDFAKAYYTAQEEAIDSVEEIIQSYQIDCQFHRLNSVVYTADEQKKAAMQDEFQACLDLGIDCEYICETKYPVPLKAGIRFHQQAQFHPVKYLHALASIISEAGISIYEHTPVTSMEERDDAILIKAGGYEVTAKHVVFATQFPFLDKTQFYFTKLINEQSELMMALYDEPLPDEQIISCDDQLDSYRTYRYMDETYLLAGGHKHPVGRFDQGHLEDFFMRNRSRFHLGKHFQHWSSQDYMTADHIAVIGPLKKDDDRILFASGYQKWGNATGTIAGKLLCAYVLNHESQYKDMFDPHRRELIFSPTFIKDNWDTIKTLVKSKLASGAYELPKAGDGTPMEIDEHMYGVFTDQEQLVHIVDITCPHMGCTCVFNPEDKTWDCPCHGSRFDIDGNIIKGPASKPLHAYGEGRNHIDPHILK